MKKLNPLDLNDDYFIENGYWEINNTSLDRDGYQILDSTEKFRKLIDTCLDDLWEKVSVNGKPMIRFTIITPEKLLETINNPKHRRLRQLKTMDDLYRRVGPIGRPKGKVK